MWEGDFSARGNEAPVRAIMPPVHGLRKAADSLVNPTGESVSVILTQSLAYRTPW